MVMVVDDIERIQLMRMRIGSQMITQQRFRQNSRLCLRTERMHQLISQRQMDAHGA